MSYYREQNGREDSRSEWSGGGTARCEARTKLVVVNWKSEERRGRRERGREGKRERGREGERGREMGDSKLRLTVALWPNDELRIVNIDIEPQRVQRFALGKFDKVWVHITVKAPKCAV